MTEAICKACSDDLRIGMTEHGPRYFTERPRSDGGHVQMGRGMWRIVTDGMEIKAGEWAAHASSIDGLAIRFALHDDVCGKPEVAPSKQKGTPTRDTGSRKRTHRGFGRG